MAELINEVSTHPIEEQPTGAVSGDEQPTLERPQLSAQVERLSCFRCSACGYGASSRIAPERCPMCGGGTWEYEVRRWSSDLDRPLRREGTS